MKTRLVLSALVLLNAFSSHAAEAGPACAAKIANIQAQLADAKANGRAQQATGLNEALKATQAHCTDASLARDRDARVEKAQPALAKRQRELASAEHGGVAKKIEKRRAKLAEAQRVLADAEKPLLN